MKENTKIVIKSVLVGILIYVVEIIFIFGLVKLIAKIVDTVRARKLDKKHGVKIPENAELDTKPWVETTKPIDGTTWGMLKPYVLKSEDNIKVSIFKVWEDATMKDVIDYILRYYITTKALVSVIYKGKVLDVWITPGTGTMYLDRAEKVKFKVDENFLNMKVKMTKENIHLALIED